MRSIEYLLLEFEGEWVTKVPFNGGFLDIDPAFRPTETLQTVAKVVALPEKVTTSHVNNLTVGDTVRVVSTSLNNGHTNKVPLFTNDKGSGIYEIYPFEVIYRISPTFEMQNGYVAIKKMPMDAPKKCHIEKIANVDYYVTSTGLVHSMVDWSKFKNQGVVQYVGQQSPDVEFELKSGDMVVYKQDHEFDNAGWNEINGESYTFVEQSDILATL